MNGTVIAVGAPVRHVVLENCDWNVAKRSPG